MERILKPVSGFLALIIALLLLAGGIYLLANNNNEAGYVVTGIIMLIVAFFLMKGLTVIQPNYSVVLTFFGKYVGSLKENGLLFVNPL
jgi:regulator of protease activity HflC (stomatin/prohibitin superfamily)